MERQEYPLIARASVAVVVGLGLVSCNETTPPPQDTQSTCFYDKDCDGILDLDDRSPTVTDRPDVDGDTQPNASDPYPYDQYDGAVPPDPIPIPAPASNAPSGGGYEVCADTTLPDLDGDAIPSICDPGEVPYDPGLAVKDTDGDGISDNYDEDPDKADRDGDGIKDGVDESADDSDNDGIPNKDDPKPYDKDANNDGFEDGIG